jgi:hypothetical protein
MTNAKVKEPFEFQAKVTSVKPESRRIWIEIDYGGEGFRFSIPLKAVEFEVEPGMKLIVEGINFGPGLDMRILRFKQML